MFIARNTLSKLLGSSTWAQKAGGALIAFSAFIVIFTFYPALKEEVRYFFSQEEKKPILTREEAREAAAAGQEQEAIIPADEDFGIVIPKIAANSRVLPDVDWRDARAYQQALAKGVAHAEGTAKPGEPGNVFLFAHSGVDFYEAARYNAVFYLLGKLGKDDPISVFYQGRRFEYRVREGRTIEASDTSWLTEKSAEKRLILMTCWPAGTTWKRFIIIADQI